MKLKLYSTGKDQTGLFRLIWANACDGDTIQLIPQGGRPFMLAQPIDWTSIYKSVHIRAVGATIRWLGANDLQPLITYGAPLGKRNPGSLSWKGGFLFGSLALQNLSCSTVKLEQIAGGNIKINTDTVSAYLSIRCPGGIQADGLTSAIQLNQLNNSAWANNIAFHEIPDLGAGITSNAIAEQTNLAATTPGLWTFDTCTFETQTPQNLFSGAGWNALFHNCWFEGPLSLGNLPTATLVFSLLRGNVNWLNDSRAVIVPPAIV